LFCTSTPSERKVRQETQKVLRKISNILLERPLRFFTNCVEFEG
jgi:hypothetical protein